MHKLTLPKSVDLFVTLFTDTAKYVGLLEISRLIPYLDEEVQLFLFNIAQVHFQFQGDFEGEE